MSERKRSALICISVRSTLSSWAEAEVITWIMIPTEKLYKNRKTKTKSNDETFTMICALTDNI